MVGPYRRAGAQAETVLPVLLALALAFGSSACRAENQPPALSDLSGVEVLKAQFNADAGRPRIVLLLSPT